MIIIAGTIQMEPGTRATFFEAVAPMVAASAAEAGCHTYAFTPDPDDDDLIRLFELWDDADSLDAHARSDHMATWVQRSRELPVASRDLRKYVVADSGPLG